MLRILIAIYPLLYIDYAGAIIDLEGVVCGLGRDRVDLADEGKLTIIRSLVLQIYYEWEILYTCVTSLPSILKSLSGWGCCLLPIRYRWRVVRQVTYASRICLIVTGRTVSFPYV